MKALFVSLLVVFTFSQVGCPRPRPRPNTFPVEKVKVIKAEYYRSKNITDNHIEKILALDIPQKVKDWVKKQNINKTNTKADIKVKYNDTNGGNATGELYYFSKHNFRKNTEVRFNYGTAEATLKPNLPTTKRECRGHGRKRVCKNVTIPKEKLTDTIIKKRVEMKMRGEIGQVIKRKIKNEELKKKKNKTTK